MKNEPGERKRMCLEVAKRERENTLGHEGEHIDVARTSQNYERMNVQLDHEGASTRKKRRILNCVFLEFQISLF